MGSTTKRCNGKGPRALLARLLSRRDGISAVEVALLAPVLLLITMGMVDYGLLYTRQTQLANTVRAGTQYAMIRRPVDGYTKEIQQHVGKYSPEEIPGHPQTVEVLLLCECPGGGATACVQDSCGVGVDRLTFIQISIQEDYPMLLNWQFIPPVVTLRQEATLRLN